MTVTPERKRLYGRLHQAATAAGCANDGEYRARLVELTGKDSATKLTDIEIRAAIDAFERAAGARKDTRRRADTPHARKARALWVSLYHLGRVDHPGEKSLAAFVKRQHGVDDLRFLPAREAEPVIEALKDMAAKAGVDWAAWGFMPAGTRERFAVVSAQWKILVKAGAAPALDLGAYTHAVIGKGSPAMCSDAELDRMISMLGSRVRALKGAA